MRERRTVMYKKGVFWCPLCNCRFVHENWIEQWRIRCPKCGSSSSFEDTAVEEHVEEETRKY